MTTQCPLSSADAAKVENARRTMIDNSEARKLSEILKAISDPTRIRIITAISTSELCVCEIASALNQSQSLVSHQLQALRLLRLVKLRKSGRNMHYSLNTDSALKIIEECRRMR